jgi:hypothetical protein
MKKMFLVLLLSFASMFVGAGSGNVFCTNAYAGTPGGDMAASPNGLADTYWESSGSQYLYFSNDGTLTICSSKKYHQGKLIKNAEVIKVENLELFDKGVNYTLNAKIDTQAPPYGATDILMYGTIKNEQSKGYAPFRAVHRLNSNKIKFENCFKKYSDIKTIQK